MATENAGMEATQLMLLLNWMSPAFPIGTYAYSHGLEWAIEHGDVRSASDVEQWIGDVITTGSGWNDAVVFALAWTSDIKELNQLALALCSSRERHVETTQLGSAFRVAAGHFTPLDAWDGDLAYPVSAAVACAAMNIPCNPALLAFLQGFSNVLISVAVRLVPLGQTAGLEVMRNLMALISRTASRACSATLEDLGSNTIISDISAMKHETQASRIFRS